MLTRNIAIFLLFAFLASGFSRYFVYAGFQINSKYIAENLCVNKSRPWMNCKGKCYLMNKLRKATEKEKKQELETSRHGYHEVLPQSTYSSIVLRPAFDMPYPKQPVDEIVHRSLEVFQPPKISA